MNEFGTYNIQRYTVTSKQYLNNQIKKYHCDITKLNQLKKKKKKKIKRKSKDIGNNKFDI